MIDIDEYILRCDCGELWNSTVLSFIFEKDIVYEGTKNEMPTYQLCVSQNIQEVGFWQRLINCFRYLFKQRKFWNYGETSLSLTDKRFREDVENLIVFLNNAVNTAKRAEEKRNQKID